MSGLLDNHAFLGALQALYTKRRGVGSVFLTMKRYIPHTPTGPHATETKVLIRATDSKKKISTLVGAREHVSFQIQLGNLLKANYDALKKKERRAGTRRTVRRAARSSA
eukprot:gnl/Spiro4/15353_TR8256_c0_g1_i1.p1 gnl/Spiro4/15353_TR8256_c0_g1~~gnl/Spiro4/15353_TR8256_c0_g1_i1.p1  ORF type:complete len:127 (+),score=29.93 gnl/Spiro4/15353_TR8256_c0_g1_i1:57-383(+)